MDAAAANEMDPSDGIEGDFAMDPLFVAPTTGDFTLLPGSPVRDARDPNPEFNDQDGSRNNIGVGKGR